MKKKKRGFPYWFLLALLVLLNAALVGDDSLWIGIAMLSFGFFLIRGFGFSSELEQPSEGDPPYDRWMYRMNTDRAFRNKILAGALGLYTACAAGGIFWFRDRVILWRGVAILGLCALGLLWLLVDALLLRLRRKREEKDRSNYPLPTVNMTFDQAAMADSRTRALQTRLNQLEAWRRSGMIGSGEYEALRERAIRQLGTPDGAPKGDRPGKGE